MAREQSRSNSGERVTVIGPDWVHTYQNGRLVAVRENSAAVAERHSEKTT